MEDTEQILKIEATVSRLSSKCFRHCDMGQSGGSFDEKGFGCLRHCIDNWINARGYVNERWNQEYTTVVKENKSLDRKFTSL